MAPALRAAIGPRNTIAELAASWTWARMVPLTQGFALVPLTARLREDIIELVDDPRPAPFGEFMDLPSEVELVLRELSAAGAVGYIETDYAAGVGTQSAIGWRDHKIAFGPVRSESSWGDGESRTEPPGERAVNQLLAWLGVRTDGRRDEFDVLVLNRFRDTESAAAKYGTKPERK